MQTFFILFVLLIISTNVINAGEKKGTSIGAVILYHAQITILGHQPFKGAFLRWAYWKTTLILL